MVFQTLFKWVSQFHINKVHLIKKSISKGLPIFFNFSVALAVVFGGVASVPRRLFDRNPEKMSCGHTEHTRSVISKALV